ncbi:nucleoside deaminase [Tsukamurella strandjordii]|uniref:nucleoside deaminase n=1 Tax=Tsukamurella TaxID=2060 RepID=UPI001C7D7E4E|nr:nucleoside deaminase [Tsukamurella sp. TY48]GIZ96213.1 hypothetical protein TTY48_08250 [Tsukamurella sp. TY48]
MTLSRRSLFPAALTVTVASAFAATNPGAVFAAPSSPRVRDASALSGADRAYHEGFMRQAVAEGRKNASYPFGAVIVDRRTDAVVARGANSSKTNPILHGEIVAINDYADRGLSGWADTTLYTTGEPCSMCMSAMAWCGIRTIVWATSIAGIRAAGISQIDLDAVDVASRSAELNPRGFDLISGVLREETDVMFLQRKR